MADRSLLQASSSPHTPQQLHQRPPSSRASVPDFARELFSNRWLSLAAASWVESCSGVAYMFSLYSQSFKDSLGYNQTQVDLVGMAKDIGGNVGIVSGIVGDLAPPWVVLAIGATQNTLGYLGTWLALTGRIKDVPFWAVMGMIGVGCNGATFFNTAGLVTCVKNFPASRGPIVGLLKGYIGLSGALFTQLYLAFYAPDKDSFILMSAWFPTLVAILAMPAIHHLPAPTYDPHERPNLLTVLACSICTALFLLGVTLLDHFVDVSRVASLTVAAVVFAALASPAFVAWKQVEKSRAQQGNACLDVPPVEEGVVEEGRRLLGGRSRLGNSSSAGTLEASGKSGGGDKRVRQRTRSPPFESEDDASDSEASNQEPSIQGKKPLLEGSKASSFPEPPGRESEGVPEQPPPPHFPRVGEDHSLQQAVMTLNFWLIYLAMTGASGSGLTAINNLGQFGRSMGYGQNEVGVFVSLMSIWNFLGRVGAGYVSEYFFYEKGCPRPLFMMLTQLSMAVGHVIFASALPGSLYVGSVVVGLCYGSQWGLMPAVASEIFGLKYFGTLYNWLTITNPTGSYFLSVCVAGYLYDYEAEREAAPPLPTGAMVPAPPPGVPKACHGAHCFRLTFLIMACSCLVAASLSGILTAITYKYYADEFARRKALVVSRIASAELQSGN